MIDVLPYSPDKDRSDSAVSPFDALLSGPSFPDAICATTDPDLWYPLTHRAGDPVKGISEKAKEAKALSLCHECPHEDDCRDLALANRIEYGIWGGLTEEDRETIWAQDEQENVA